MIDVSWLTIDGQDVILFTFHPSWTWRHFRKAQQKVGTMLEFSSTTFPVLFDFHHASNLPPGMIKEMRNIIESWHPNGTPLIVIAGNRIIYNAFAVVARMLSESNVLDGILFVDSLADAEASIRRQITKHS